MNIFIRHKAIVSYFSFSMAGSVLGFIASLLMVRLMLPEEFGRFAIFNSILFFSAPLLSFSADGLINVNKSKLNENDFLKFKHVYITHTYILWAILQIVSIFIWAYFEVHASLYVFIPLLGLIRFLTNFASIEYILEGNSTKYGILAFSNSLAALLFTWILLELNSPSTESRIIALLLSDLLLLAVRYRGRLQQLYTFKFDRQIVRSIHAFGFPLIFSIAPAWAMLEADKIIVGKLLDLRTVGYYAAACTVAGVVETFNRAILNSINPKIFKELSIDGVDVLRVTKKYIYSFMLLSATFCICFLILYSICADYIFTEKYKNARDIVYVSVIFSLGNGLYRVIGLVNDFFSMTKIKLLGIILGALIAVSLTTVGALQYGAIGAAIGVGSGYLTLSLTLWINLKNRFKI